LTADAATSTLLSEAGEPARVIKKVLLTDAMRSPSATAPIITIAVAPDAGPYAIDPGNVPIVSFTFKSGDTWVPNVSNIDSFHRFLPIFVGSANVMPYKGRWNKAGDHSASSILFSTFPSSYNNPVIIEAQNTVAFDYEYLAAQLVMSCSACGLVGTGGSIKENTLFGDVKAFPNPANTQLNVPVSVSESANVTVSISNMLGQVIATQNMGAMNIGQKETAVFNTTSLSAGVYLYTIEANGQRVSNRFSVSH
jgi:hypothetical protein